MEIDQSTASSSDEENILEVDRKNKAEIKLNMGCSKTASIVLNTLSVDREPSRSQAHRLLRADDDTLIVQISSFESRSLQKSIANVLDMCELARSTVELADSKAWLKSGRPAGKKRRLNET